MSDVLINWFVTNLGGKVGKELILFIISMVPILELLKTNTRIAT